MQTEQEKLLTHGSHLGKVHKASIDEPLHSCVAETFKILDDPNINGACKIDFSAWGKNDITSREKKALMRLKLQVQDGRGMQLCSPQRPDATAQSFEGSRTSKSRNSRHIVDTNSQDGGTAVFTVKGTIGRLSNSDAFADSTAQKRSSPNRNMTLTRAKVSQSYESLLNVITGTERKDAHGDHEIFIKDGSAGLAPSKSVKAID